MQLHERFMTLPKINLEYLYSVKAFSQKIDPDFFVSFEELEIFRMVLAHEYRGVVGLKKPLKTSIAFNLDVKEMLRVKPSQDQLLMIRDILTLQMVLYSSDENLLIQLKKFRASNEKYILEDADSRILYMKFFESFLDGFHLRSFVLETPLENVARDLAEFVLEDARNWLAVMEDAEWKFLPSFVSKSIFVIGRNEILPRLWDLILGKEDGPQNLFSILCIVVEAWFPSDSMDAVDSSYAVCFKEELWSLLLKGLTSSIQYVRKQALYLIKKMNQMKNLYRKEKMNNVPKNGIVPFVCEEQKQGDMSMENVANTFFLILEALEEKQKHLITPILPFLATLVNACREHRNCGDCFSVVWLHVVFERLLQHENSSVMKEGLRNALKMDSDLYNEDFIKLLARSLNNASLYKHEDYQDYPEIVKELSSCFARAEESDSDLISRFLLASSEISWGPIAIYHVTSAIRLVPEQISRVRCFWNEDCLEALTRLVEENLKRHSKMLRFASQMNVIEALTSFTEIRNLLATESVLSAFPRDEALSRENCSWEHISNWLKKDVAMKSKAREFVVHVCKVFARDETTLRSSVGSVSLMTMLLYDAGLIFKDKDCPAKRSFYDLLNCLSGVSARPYANVDLTIRIFELVSNLLDFCSKNNDRDQALVQLVSPCVDSGLTSVLAKLKNPAGLKSENQGTLARIAATFLKRSRNKSVFAELRKASVNVLEQSDKCDGFQRLFAMQILYLCENLDKVLENENEVLDTLLGAYQLPFLFPTGNPVDLTGKIVSEYLILVAKFIVARLKRNRNMRNFDWLKHALILLNSTGTEILPVVCELLYGIIAKNMFDAEDLPQIEMLVKLCWTHALHGKKSGVFLLSVEWIVEILRVLADRRLKESWSVLQEVTLEILNEGNGIPNLKKLVLSRLISPRVEFVNEILVDCLLHGLVIRQDQKIEIQTCETISVKYETRNLSDRQSDVVSRLNCNVDATVRAQATIELLQLVTFSGVDTEDLFSALMKKLEENKSKRYFGDSHVHRRNHRILQALLVLQPTLSENCKKVLHGVLCELLLSDNHQHSVRLMSEWLLTRIYVEDEELRNNIWNLFSEMNERRPGSLRSVLCMIYHVSRYLSIDRQKDFLDVALFHITPCCMGQQFSMRLYSQVIFAKIYDTLKTTKELKDVEEKYMSVYKGVQESLRHGNLMTNSVKLNEDFYLTVFCVEKHYTLETIYLELPRLTNVCAEEWIPPQIFQGLHFVESLKYSGLLTLYNDDDQMKQAKVPRYISKSEGSDVNLTRVDDISIDMQKKAIPWKTIVPFSENLAELQIASKQREKVLNSEGGIIVVASLVDRLPNLGGITRTCEIFGARELVISNHKHIQSKEFQNLSVSAERWINITEVKPYQLPEYFLSKKESGWSLVGAEQTVNSINLVNMEFDEKTVLVLGNEKDGIPANLIPLLDKCVEIPQLGVTRSLNVHVTSAICIWQYASQHLLK